MILENAHLIYILEIVSLSAIYYLYNWEDASHLINEKVWLIFF